MNGLERVTRAARLASALALDVERKAVNKRDPGGA